MSPLDCSTVFSISMSFLVGCYCLRARKCTTITRSLSFILGKPNWSVRSLNLHSDHDSDDVVNESTVDSLAKLACIDLNSAKVSKSEIIRDVNVILRCA